MASAQTLNSSFNGQGITRPQAETIIKKVLAGHAGSMNFEANLFKNAVDEFMSQVKGKSKAEINSFLEIVSEQ